MTPAKRRAVILCLVAGSCLGFVALVSLITPQNRIPTQALNDVNAALLQEGFKLESSLTTADNVSLGVLTPIISRMPGLGQSVQKRSIHRQYGLNGSKLGIDFDCTGDEKFTLNASVSTDPSNILRAKKIVADLSAMNSNLPIWFRTNAPAAPAR